MRRKFVELDEYKQVIKSEERLTFSTKSPFSSITEPSETIFLAWHGSMNLVAKGVSGTLYVCREGIGDPVSFNFDVYSLSRTQDGTQLEIVFQKMDYHWTDEIPTLLIEKVPEWVQEEVQKVINCRKEIKIR